MNSAYNNPIVTKYTFTVPGVGYVMYYVFADGRCASQFIPSITTGSR